MMTNQDNENGATKTETVLKKPKSKKNYFVGVHLGAGNHSTKKQKKYKILCNTACKKALTILKRGGSAQNAALQATIILENSGLVNAGIGSNLTMDKKIECDAGFMSGDGAFGGIGAAPGIINPILAAQMLAELQSNPGEALSCGRVPPNLLVGAGANTWASSEGIPTRDETMISAKSEKQYLKLLEKLKQNDLKLKAKLENNVGDTIGVIVLDSFGHVAASVSSGGNWLKFPGRVGHAPQYGAGCWAADERFHNSEDLCTVAISTSGVGEMLSKLHWASGFAKTLMDETAIPVDGLKAEIDKFLGNPELKLHKEPKLLGVIGLIWDGKRGEVIWGHTSKSFIVAYGGSKFNQINMECSYLRNVLEKYAVGSASI